MSYDPFEHMIHAFKMLDTALAMPPRITFLECDYCHQTNASVRLRGWSGFEAYCCDYCEDTARDAAQDAKAAQHRMERS